MFQSRIFSLSVLTDNTHVHIGVAGHVTGHIFNQDNGRIDVEFLTKSDIERLVAGSFNGGI